MPNILRIGQLSINLDEKVSGQYGKVFRGCFQDVVDVSILRVDKTDYTIDADLLRKVDLVHLHPNIVRFYGLADDDVEFK